jgi:dsRNA-specific ribonuclease
MNELAKFNKVILDLFDINVIEQIVLSIQVAPKYELIKESGPAHCRQFEVRLTVADETYQGTGTSIKRAQQMGKRVYLH